MSKTPALENTEESISVVVLGGRFDTQTAVFFGAGPVAAGAAGVALEVEVEAAALLEPFEVNVVSVTSTSPTFLFFCFSILCCRAKTAFAGV